MIITDTNAFRHLGDIFARQELDPALKQHFAFSPLTCLELLSQLAGRGRDAVLRQIRAMPNWANAGHARLLPWMTEVFAGDIFGVVREEEAIRLNDAFEACSRMNEEQLLVHAEPLRQLLDEEKDRSADAFQQLLNSYRMERPSDEVIRDLVITSVGNRLRLQATPQIRVVARDRLSAYLEFELVKLRNAAQARDYLARNHRNDLLDAEQLVFLSEPRLHFLTLDDGFNRIDVSPQRNRIHVAEPEQFRTSETVEQLLRDIVAAL